MALFFISDIHGYHYPMMKLLEKAQFDPAKDRLIVGGDMIDRGPDSGLVIQEIKRLSDESPNVRATIGNHEEMALWFYSQQSNMWLEFGGKEAISSFDRVFSPDEFKEHLKWMAHLPIVWEDDAHIFTHAGLNENYPINSQPRESLWIEKIELYAFRKELLLDYTHNRKVVHGHTPHMYVTDDGARISCDLGGGVFEKSPGLALVDLTNNRYYKYHFNSRNIRKYPIQSIP